MGPRPVWDDAEPSPARPRRIARRKTMVETATEIPRSLGQLHNREVRGLGSPELWRRLAEVLEVSVAEIKSTAPSDPRQLELKDAIPAAGRP